MPNRCELAVPAQPARSGAKEAWTIIGFCMIGWLISIGLFTSMPGALPRLPW